MQALMAFHSDYDLNLYQIIIYMEDRISLAYTKSPFWNGSIGVY
jgi:hypothetical protein